jgi:predicted XRE-type DNA-binding protein
MANRSAETRAGDTTVTHGTGNVFADLGYPDAEERQTKLRLAHAINDVVGRRRLTQEAVAAKLGVTQPKVSALANYKLDGFSVERLMVFLTALDLNAGADFGCRRVTSPAADGLTGHRGSRMWRRCGTLRTGHLQACGNAASLR